MIVYRMWIRLSAFSAIWSMSLIYISWMPSKEAARAFCCGCCCDGKVGPPLTTLGSEMALEGTFRFVVYIFMELALLW